VAADKAYSSHANGVHLRKRNIQAVIPEKADQAANRKRRGSRGGRPLPHDVDLHRDCNTVERLINKLKTWRGLAARNDKTPESYLAGLHLRGTIIWIRSLHNTEQLQLRTAPGTPAAVRYIRRSVAMSSAFLVYPGCLGGR
jgi:DDE family transposase